MELTIHSFGGGAKGDALTVSDIVFDSSFNEPLVHQVVTAYLATGRSGTVAQKTRSQVSGGGAKPFRQKGTGRARAGTIRSPLWRSGGVTFAAAPRDYSQKVNRKMYIRAFRSIFSELVRQDRLKVVENFSIEAPKTKILIEKLKGMGLGKVLLVQDVESADLELASRNIPNVLVSNVRSLSPATLIGFDHVLVSASALKSVEEKFS